MASHTGSCLCAAVKFQVDGDFARFFLCHCSRCRKTSGSAHRANLFSGDGKLTWLAGSDKVKTYNHPGTRHTAAFCTDCGGSLPNQRPGIGVVVPAGALDSPLTMRPTAHIFGDSRADWDHELHLVQVFPQLPNG